MDRDRQFFRVPLDETPTQQIKSILRQAQTADESLDRFFSLTAAQREEEPELLHSIAAEIETLASDLEREQNVDTAIVALVGQTSEGKSTLLNLLSELSVVKECHYGVNPFDQNLIQSNEEGLRGWLHDHLEGIQDVRAVLEKQCQVVSDVSKPSRT
jgi:ABC-type multidrug transport system fused ATPase/permease subunit